MPSPNPQPNPRPGEPQLTSLILRRWFPLASLLAVLPLCFGCKRAERTPDASVRITAPIPAPARRVTPASVATESMQPATVPIGNAVRISSTTGTGTEWALQQDAIKNDPEGQWANTATASSCFSDCATEDGNSAFQATGKPNVDHEGDDDSAWSPKEQDAGIEWLNLSFPTPVFANGLRIRESFNAGSIVKVELYDEQNQLHRLWAGSDPTTGLNYFTLNFPTSTFKTNRVKITLATNIVTGYNEIDAVQLVAAKK